MQFKFGAVAVLGALLFASVGDLASAKSPLRWKLSIDLDFAKRNPAGRMEASTAKGSQVYWYVVYTVKNTHEEAVPLNLFCSAVTDVNKDGVSEGYYPKAIVELKKTYGDDLLDSVSATGRELAPGRDGQGRRGVPVQEEGRLVRRAPRQDHREGRGLLRPGEEGRPEGLQGRARVLDELQASRATSTSRGASRCSSFRPKRRSFRAERLPHRDIPTKNGSAAAAEPFSLHNPPA
jgi:hypothetical protein